MSCIRNQAQSRTGDYQSRTPARYRAEQHFDRTAGSRALIAGRSPWALGRQSRRQRCSVSRPIWEYRSNTAAVPVLRDVFAGKRCPCCVETSLLAPSDASSEYDPRRYTEERRALACALCGWWFAYSEAYDSSCGSTPDFAVYVVSATGAALETYAFPDHQALAVLGDE